jgi:hypothetical protein
LTANAVNLVGTITNMSTDTIEDASLHLPTTSIDLGDFAPGETRNVRIDIRYTFADLTPIIKNNNYYDPYGGYNNSASDDTAYRRDLLVGALNHVMPSQTDWGVYVTGWVENESIPASLREQKFDSLDTTRVFVRLNPGLASQEDTIIIPNGFMYEETSINGGNILYKDAYVAIPPEGYFLRFWPAIPVKFSSTQSLKLHQEINTSASNFVISLWNYETNQWEATVTDLSQNVIEISDPERYVGPGGEIRVKLDADGQKDLSLRRLDFELTVNR